MKIVRRNTFGIKDPNEKRWVEDLYKILNRNVSFGSNVDSEDQNIDGKMVAISDTGPANTQVIVNHDLNRVPRFIDIKYKSVAGDWYDSGAVWTNTQVFLKFTTANMSVRLFIH